MVVKAICLKKTVTYQSLVDNNLSVERALQITTTRIQEEVDMITAIHILGKLTSTGCITEISNHTISIYPERKISGCGIHITTKDGRLCYSVSVEGTVMFPTTNIIDAIQAYFLTTMVSNLSYHNGATCFGLIMEHGFYGCYQTVNISKLDLNGYNEIIDLWNEVTAIGTGTKLPNLSVTLKK